MWRSHQFNNTKLQMALGDKVRKLDIFKKVPRDISEGTNRGGFISLLTLISIGFFLFVELKNYMRPDYQAMIVTDQLFTRKQMKIHLDITLPKFPCEIISLDIQDAMMSHSPNIGSVHKHRLDRNGVLIDGTEEFQLLRESSPHRQLEIAREAFNQQRGCRLRGDFTVKEVPGNFHISSHAYHNIYARLQAQGVVKTLDMSHKINYLFFGDADNMSAIERSHPQAVLSKLNGKSFQYDMRDAPHSWVSHYHLDIVPTRYAVPYWPDTLVYQYTYNHNDFQVQHMPSLYFNYNIGGLTVVVTPEGDSLSAFLIKLCAIIGGTYTLASFLDNALDHLIDDRHKQYELIK